MITCKNDRLLELLWFVGYCIEFPTQLAVRIGGGAEWNRRVMYRAIREGYVKLFRRKHKRHVIRSLSLTQKGYDYVAQRDPEAVAMIYSRVNSSERVYHKRKATMRQATKQMEVSVMEKVCDFLKSAGVYYLATVEGTQPRVRPFGTAHIFEGKLYIQTGKSKPVSKQLTANPKCEICAFKDGVWLRVSAELVEDDRVEAKKSMLDEYTNLRAMYDENDSNTQVLYLKNAVATFSSFTAAPEVHEF